MDKPITKVEQVMRLAHRKKAIYHVRWGRPVAAAYFIGMPVNVVVGYIRMSWLYEYKPKKAPKK